MCIYIYINMYVYTDILYITINQSAVCNMENTHQGFTHILPRPLAPPAATPAWGDMGSGESL